MYFEFVPIVGGGGGCEACQLGMVTEISFVKGGKNILIFGEKFRKCNIASRS
jgi:hypothetical protein